MKFYLIVFFFFVSFATAHAQTKKSSSSSKTSATSYPKNWGIGLRLGDPTGLTVKKYLANSNALEFNVGSSSRWDYDYNDEFHANNKYKGYDYLGYEAHGGITFQAHYLFNKDIKGAKGLQWYLGVGPQLRFHSYTYSYRYDAGSDWVYVTDKATNADFGADGIIGLEYQIPKAPLSVFADANLFLELIDDPFVFYFQGGIGIRYNF